MQTLSILEEQDINPGAPAVDISDFKKRRAARAIVRDGQQRVALLYVAKHTYHKLPGGGVDSGETIIEALDREMLEEIGCRIRIDKEVGQIIEHRGQEQLDQTSYCYLAHQVGDQHAAGLTEEELADGFEMVWAASIDEAITLLEADKPGNYDGRFIQKRDLLFLKTARAV